MARHVRRGCALARPRNRSCTRISKRRRKPGVLIEISRSLRGLARCRPPINEVTGLPGAGSDFLLKSRREPRPTFSDRRRPATLSRRGKQCGTFHRRRSFGDLFVPSCARARVCVREKGDGINYNRTDTRMSGRFFLLVKPPSPMQNKRRRGLRADESRGETFEGWEELACRLIVLFS